jgi:hypothetical protein
MCPSLLSHLTLGPSLLPPRAAPLAANLARVPLLHHYVEVCELVGQRYVAMSQKLVRFQAGSKKAGRGPATGGLP